jgi:hypothetical protein
MKEPGVTVKVVKILPLIAMIKPRIYYKTYPAVDTVARLNPDTGLFDGFVMPVTVI